MSILDDLAKRFDELAEEHRKTISLCSTDLGRARHSMADKVYRKAANLVRQEELDDTSADYDLLATAIMDRLNPPDENAALVTILITAIERAADYIQSRPCMCPIGVLDRIDDPCLRCMALGRASDVKVDR